MDIAGRSVRSISHEDIASSSDVFGLESADARVLGETTIEWARWVDSGELTVPESGLLLDYDKQSLEDRLDLLNEPTNPYVDLFLSILSKFRDPETLHYVLALLHQFLAADVGLKTNFQQSTLRPGYMDVLLGIAKRPAVGEYGKCKSLQIISLLLRAGVTDSLENKVAHARLLGFFGLVNQELATAFGGFSHLLPGAEQVSACVTPRCFVCFCIYPTHSLLSLSLSLSLSSAGLLRVLRMSSPRMCQPSRTATGAWCSPCWTLSSRCS
jgi:hypothetical protein